MPLTRTQARAANAVLSTGLPRNASGSGGGGGGGRKPTRKTQPASKPNAAGVSKSKKGKKGAKKVRAGKGRRGRREVPGPEDEEEQAEPEQNADGLAADDSRAEEAAAQPAPDMLTDEAGGPEVDDAAPAATNGGKGPDALDMLREQAREARRQRTPEQPTLERPTLERPTSESQASTNDEAGFSILATLADNSQVDFVGKDARLTTELQVVDDPYSNSRLLYRAKFYI